MQHFQTTGDLTACGLAAVVGKALGKGRTKRIVGGNNGVPGAWPWSVAIYSSGVYKCGGTLISDKLILTAAHCLKGYDRFTLVNLAITIVDLY